MIVGMMPTYREGPLAASAIRTLLTCCDTIVVFEGPVGDAPEVGEPTSIKELRKNPKVISRFGSWDSEVEKRNEMLAFTRRYKPPVWGVYLDADEVLVNGQWIPDLIWAAERQRGGHSFTGEDVSVAALPLLIQEVDYSVGRIHRIIRLDLLERHVLSMSQLKFLTSDIVAVFPVVPVWRPGEPLTKDARPPMSGEPHIHHRAYYRPPVRADYRLHQEEMEDAKVLEQDALARLGIKAEVPGAIPVNQDQGLIVASDTGEVVVPSVLDYLEGR